MSTDGYGGRDVNQKVIVFTNDPENRRITITLGGPVEAFASITPKLVRLSASVEDFRADQVVVIIPSEANHFNIVAAWQVPRGDNAPFVHSLEKDEKGGETVYRLVVENRQRHAGSYYGTIYLSTDHPRRKELSINVHGYIAAPPPSSGTGAP
ncbi:MAG: hypothetical protein QMD09_07590 [Desulfatibacillaceae bacterium]|nr:hypothetical protein [Desulfatibacillaceae bacterium]